MFVLTGAVMISFSSVFVELANVGPTVSAFYRMFFGGAILLGIALFKNQSLWKSNKTFWFAVSCGLLFAVDLIFWHRSILFIGPGLATLMGNFQVFFLTLAGVLFMKEHFGWRLMVAIPLAIVGLYLIVGINWAQAGPDFKVGVWLGLATAVCYASYLLVLQRSQRLTDKLGLIPNMAVISLVAALILGLSVLVIGGESFAIPDAQSWFSLVGLGIMGQVLGWVLISKGLPDLNASVVGLVLLVQPSLAFVWDILFFGRPTTSIEIVGALIALGAIYLGSVSGKKG